jgi:hypothetical protein
MLDFHKYVIRVIIYIIEKKQPDALLYNDCLMLQIIVFVN